MTNQMNQATSFVHPKAIVETDCIGVGSRIWAFVHILKGAKIGAGCNICDHTFIENDIVIGNDVTIKSGVYLWDGVRIGDDVFIGPNATFINDKRPRSKVYPERFEETYVARGASIGANATIMCGVSIGEWAMVGAGSLVTKDVPAHAMVYGTPAKIQGYVCQCGKDLVLDGSQVACSCGKDYRFEDGNILNVRHGKLFFSQSQGKAQKEKQKNNRTSYLGRISETCVIHENVEIGKDVTVCENVIIYSNVDIGDHSFIGPNCVLGEPLYSLYKDSSNYTNPKLKIGRNSIIRSHSVIYAGSTIGDNFQTGHHITMREDSTIGKNCSLGTFGDIQGHTEIGDYCRFHSSVLIGQFSTIKNFVNIYPNVVLTNDPHPPSDTCTMGPILEDYSVICAGAVIMPGITVGKNSVVGAQSLVSRDVKPETVVLGVPARKICSIHDVRCKKGKLDKPYPWRKHFSRGMPWKTGEEK